MTTGGKSYSGLTDATGLPRTTPTPTAMHAAGGKYSPVENGQDALIFIAAFAVMIGVLYVVSRRRRLRTHDGHPLRMRPAIREVRIFSAILIVGGIGACVAGTVTGDAVPVVLGAIAAVSGVVLAALAFLGYRKTRGPSGS
jgi:purine-cytosine permease-like protein